MRAFAFLFLGVAAPGCGEKPVAPPAAPAAQPDDPKLAQLLDEFEAALPAYESAATECAAAEALSEKWAKAMGAVGQSQAKLLPLVQSIREAAAAGSRASPTQADRLKKLIERQAAAGAKLLRSNDLAPKK